MNHDSVVKCLLSERSKILGYIRAILGSWEDAEDIFQEASLLAIAKSGEIADEPHLMAWLRITCRNLARNLQRAKSRGALSLSDEVLDLLEVHWSQHAERSSDAAESLAICLEKLPQKSFELVRLRYLEELKVNQIAERLGRSVASLYVAFGRISAALAECIDQQTELRKVGHGG